jgi:3-dehydroquinate dehydratase/shikimate dehydrogenase
LGEDLGCRWDGLEQMPRYFDEGYDILINCTPAPHPIDTKWIIPETVVMDVRARPQYTPFLLDAQSKNCTLIFGYEMWINQAIGQYQVWFGDQIDIANVKELLQKALLDSLKIEF